MKLRPCTLLLTALAACAGARTSAAAPPAAPQAARCDVAPTADQPHIDGLVSARISVPHGDAGDVARALRDIFHVRPDRGDVRAILHDRRDTTLFVIATREGVEMIRKILAPPAAPPSAS